MASVRAEEAERFYEEDEDPSEIFATFDGAEKGRTRLPKDQKRPARWSERLRHALAGALRRAANSIEASDIQRS